MITLSNEILTVQITSKGAELQSLYNNKTGLEYLWSGDPAYWGKKSPVLFPVVGGLKNNQYTYEGNSYKLGRHGFARDMEFTTEAHGSSNARFVLESNHQTLAVYPFDFRFSINYAVHENVLEVTYIVENTGEQEMLFSVGAHPAFQVPLVEGTVYEDYHLLFDKEETAGLFPLSNDGLIEINAHPFFSGTNKLPLKKSLFDKDALVFKELTSTEIAIASPKHEHGLKVSFEGFPYLGIWAAKGADFVCIEPWCGIADNVATTGRLDDKEGINRLEARRSFSRAYSIAAY